MLISQPFAGLLSQSAKPTLQVPSVQTPPTHDSEALARLQTRAASAAVAEVRVVLTSQAVGRTPSQFAKPGSQAASTQVPPRHCSDALA